MVDNYLSQRSRRRVVPAMQRTNKIRSTTLVALLASSAITGCHRNATPASVPPAAEPILSQAEMVDLCVNLHSKAAACPAEFTSLNIELRIKYSPEFAQLMQDPAVRQQAQAAGVTETSADAAIARERCAEFAQPAWGAAQPRSDLARLDACYALASCDAKMQCLQPLIEPRFAYRATHRQH